MRRLVYVTIGFGAGCSLWVYTDHPGVRAALFAVLLILGALAGRDARPWQRMALVGLGCMAAFFWCVRYQDAFLSGPGKLDGLVQEAEIRAADYGAERDLGTALEGTIRLDGKPCRVMVYLSEHTAVTPGDILRGTFRFRLTIPGGQEEGTYHGGKGIFLLAYQQGAVQKEDAQPTGWDVPARLRQKIRAILQETFPEDTAPFAKALLLGDTSDLGYAVDTALKISGIRHVAAVSGLHVSILFALLGILTARKRWLMALLGFPALVLFAAVAGLTPSVSRACLMSGLMLLGGLLNREYDGPTALAFGVLVILLANPMAVTSVSLQLSAASVAGIFLFGPGIRKWMVSSLEAWGKSKRKLWLVNRLASSVSTSLSAMVLTTPLCAWYFGTISLIGPVTNLLTLWLIGGIFCGITGVCSLHFLFPEAAGLLARILSWPIRLVLSLAELLARVPLSAVYTASPYIVLWLVFVYLLLFFFLRSSSRKPGTLSCCAILGLCLALLAGWGENMAGDVSFTVVDVGQGQCLVFQSEGRTYMVDCGGDADASSADRAAAFLLSRGISRLDGFILTHTDRDHAGGAAMLLSRIDTDLVILPQAQPEIAACASGKVVYASQDLCLEFGSTRLQIYAPTFPGNSNEMSLCILFDTEKCDILVTGDRNGFGERALLRRASLPQVDILVAGHHGAANAACPELLEAVRPGIVCISAGKDNSYGHPAPELLERLTQAGCEIYCTGQQGTITIRR